jgi:hypothetical protein
MPFDENEPRDDSGRWTDGGGGSISEAEDKIKNNDFESAAVFNQKGEPILFKKGNSSTVMFTPEEKLKMKGGIVTHNHPSGQSFSVQDIAMVSALKLSKVRVVSKNHAYEFEPPEKGLKPTWQAIYRDTEIRVNNKLFDDVKAGKIKESDALNEIDHLIMTKFSQKIRAKYKKENL